MPDYDANVNYSITPAKLNQIVNNFMKGKSEFKYKIYLFDYSDYSGFCFIFLFSFSLIVY
jgi:hypothetical protein